MKKLLQSVALFLLISGLASGMAFYLQRSGDDSLPAQSEPAQNPGILLAIEKGCDACHSIDGSAGIGPTWKNLYGSYRLMADGSQQVADEPYLRRSMLEPAAEVVAGFENIMIPPELSEVEIDQLIRLMRELSSANPHEE